MVEVGEDLGWGVGGGDWGGEERGEAGAVFCESHGMRDIVCSERCNHDEAGS